MFAIPAADATSPSASIVWPVTVCAGPDSALKFFGTAGAEVASVQTTRAAIGKIFSICFLLGLVGSASTDA